MESRSRLQDLLPKLVLAPSFVIVVIFVYGFIAYTGFLSLTDSKMLPSYNVIGLTNYAKLWALPHWWRAITNLAIFASLYIIICSVLGLVLAILLDQKIRGEGLLRPIYLYPMALSFVTGTAWKWFLDPGIGLQKHHAALGLGKLQLHLDQGQPDGDLLRRHRRGLAVLRLRHGHVPGGPARRRQRDDQGGADRRARPR